ncbi:RNA recognition motif domain containing protein [Babesia bovis T2Bo]|uniref:RNA recognition motif (RRM)-containing protein n=1 Tax=Babesia bovis TaxID=5865 RepID=A7AU30_BABBO|nr:RNA recognition motif domain containing protein [Babesia bovis T2Bo]EDO06441.1 RNA recognition motif domain containing protein [Babesia bovis T2Bo]BAN65933.1 RNA recognition motif (RRM)-containing protein [Babesia bovis]|eukprot:XP_001610009.1 RNA recognition motif (RRM)-containing protein [Babesia bovis T2Bo]
MDNGFMPADKGRSGGMKQITDEEAARVGSRMAAGTKGTGRIHLRKAAGNVWNDPTLDDWPQNDFRIFCGDLGNEVTDDTLANAFKKYPSFQRARVIRDRVSGKSKGYGFVSMLSPDDMLAALNEMNNKFVGNRPIRVMRSKWKDRDIGSEKNRQLAGMYQMSADNSKTLRKFKKLGKSVTGGKRANLVYEPKTFKRNKIYLSTGVANRFDNRSRVAHDHLLDNI